MRDLPIVFSAPMVRAILDGSKTQTRRAVRPQPPPRDDGQDAVFRHGEGWRYTDCEYSADDAFRCPYGAAGDRLWVRESFADLQGTGIEHRQPPDYARQRYAYAADTRPGSASDEARKDYGIRWTPSIHMPRGASRITLEVAGIRVERLQAISEQDAEAEGVGTALLPYIKVPADSPMARKPMVFNGARDAFGALWESINGAGSWDANRWVWVIEFRRLRL